MMAMPRGSMIDAWVENGEVIVRFMPADGGATVTIRRRLHPEPRRPATNEEILFAVSAEESS